MKKILSLLVVITFYTNLFAQQTRGGFDPNNRPKIGTVSGKVLEKENQKTIDYAVIEVLSVRDNKVVTGGITDKNGAFNIQQIPAGRYVINIKFLGFKSFTSEFFTLLPDNPLKDFGSVYLEKDSKVLATANIISEKQELLNNLDKRVYSNDKNAVSAGGNASDVLRQVPGVNVDIDGKISLRGSENVTILIDGKPSSMLGTDRKSIMSSIPAGSIESVELITNPSAKYSAEGMAGIVNIVLKKNKLQGFNGSVNLSAGVVDKYTAGVNLNYRTKKYNLFGGITGKSDFRRGSGYSNRQNIYPDTTFYVNQNNTQNSKNKNGIVRAGIEYYLTDRKTLSASTTYNQEIESQPENVAYTYYDENHKLSNTRTRYNLGANTSKNADFAVGFRQLFPTPKQELTADLSYSMVDKTNLQNYYQNDAWTGLNTHNGTNLIAKMGVLNAQFDYVYPNSKFTRFEFGAKSTTRNIDADNVAFLYSLDGLSSHIDPTITNHLLFKEQINAGYLTYAGIFKTFAYQVGLRSEYTDQSIFLANTNFYQKNRYINFFPSAIIRQPLLKNQILQLSYSRRINRPGYQSQNPFLDISDPENKRIGNPSLKPELIHSVEFGYQKTADRYNFTGSIYYKHSTDLNIRYRSIQKDGTSLISFINAYSSDNYGIELISTAQLKKWWDLTANVNLFQTKINATNIEADLQNDNFSWFARLNSTVRFWKNAAFQFSGNYNAPTVLAQGTFSSMFILSSALKKDFLNNKLTVSINVNDFLNQMRMEMHTQGATFQQDMLRRKDRRSFMLSVVYRFGSLNNETSSGKRKGGRGQDMGSGGGMDDM
jgi:outer membrane receptor protein involved in Fe transport